MEHTEKLAEEREIARKLHLIGVPANIKGYHYLIEAIKIVIADKKSIFEIKKNIYEPVAKKFNVTARSVSSAISRAISIAWERGELDTLQDYFSYSVAHTKGIATNSEFISIVAERICLGFEN